MSSRLWKQVVREHDEALARDLRALFGCLELRVKPGADVSALRRKLLSDMAEGKPCAARRVLLDALDRAAPSPDSGW